MSGAAGPSSLPGAWNELAGTLGGELFTDLAHRRLYACDASPYEVLPSAVACPRDAEDCRHIVEFCAAESLALIPRGGGTGLAGQCVGSGLVVDCSRHLSRILEIDAEAGTACVEPGVVPAELNRALAPQGLMFGPDPSTLNRCNIGGMVGTNAWGAHAPRDGTTRDNLVGARLLLDDASVLDCEPLDAQGWAARARGSGRSAAVHAGIDAIMHRAAPDILAAYPDRRLICNNNGYALDALAAASPWSPGGPPGNLAQLICGAEGTLRLITRARLRLRPLPAARRMLCAHFDSLESALGAVPAVLALEPAAVELLDREVLSLTAANLAQRANRAWLQGDPAAVLVIEFTGPPALAEERVAALADLLGRTAGCFARPAIAPAQIDRVWSLRRAGLGLLMGLPEQRRAVTGLEDSAVAPAHLADYIAVLQREFERQRVSAVMYGSVSMGLVHVRPLLDWGQAGERQRFAELLEFQAAAVRRFRGSLSTKHGDGRLRAAQIEAILGQPMLALLREVKGLFDPRGLFNPGKVLDPPPLLADLRATPRSAATASAGLRWERGLAGALGQCQGAGACRKRDEGAMCPSYRASGDELLSTRGRANLFRQSWSGDWWAEPELARTLALCLACKSCRSECPANVDMARLKAEFLHQRWRRGGLPRHAWIAANHARLSRWAGLWPALANALLGTRSVRRLLGVHPQRQLPPLAPRRFSRLAAARPPAQGPGTPVILLLDPYTEFYEPQIGTAAMQVLRRCGFAPRPSRCLALGRSAFSQGALEQSRHQVEAAVRILGASSGPLVGLEPSEVLFLREDAAALPLSDRVRRQLAAVVARSYLLEEFLAERVDEDGWRRILADPQARPRGVRVHVHCHQRALAGTDTAMQPLAGFPGLEARLLPATCCGMAGDFGYRVDTYALSMQVAASALLPALDELEPGIPVVANGTSCRHQIRDASATRPVHLAELLLRMTREPSRDG